MPELMFVLKSLAIATIVMIFLQIKMGPTSLENQMHQWIQTSSVSNYLQGVSAGAAHAIRDGSKATSDFFRRTFGHESSLLKAGRLNFEFKRSQKYQEEQQEAE